VQAPFITYSYISLGSPSPVSWTLPISPSSVIARPAAAMPTVVGEMIPYQIYLNV
jgi:hypothetical protein